MEKDILDYGKFYLIKKSLNNQTIEIFREVLKNKK